MSGAKRAPSSSVKNATASGRAVVDAVLFERLDHLQPGEHAEVAVVAPAGARRCRCASRSSPAPPSGSVPARVATTLPMASMATSQAEVAHPRRRRDRGPARSASVSASRAQPRSPFGPSIGADLAELVEPRPQAVAVDAEVVARSRRQPRHGRDRSSKAAISRERRAERVDRAVEQLGAALGGRRRSGRRCTPSGPKSLDSQPKRHRAAEAHVAVAGERARARCGAAADMSTSSGARCSISDVSSVPPWMPMPELARPATCRPGRAARRGGRGTSSARGAAAARGWRR